MHQRSPRPALLFLFSCLAFARPAAAQIRQDDAVNVTGGGVSTNNDIERMRTQSDQAFEDAIRTRIRGNFRPEGHETGYISGYRSAQPAAGPQRYAASPSAAGSSSYNRGQNLGASAGQAVVGGIAGSFFNMWGQMMADSFFGGDSPRQAAPYQPPRPPQPREVEIEKEDPQTTAAIEELTKLGAASSLEGERRLLEALEDQYARIAAAGDPTAQLLCAACYSKRAADSASKGAWDDAGLLSQSSLESCDGGLLGSEACPDCPGGFPPALKAPGKDTGGMIAAYKKGDERFLKRVETVQDLKSEARETRERAQDAKEAVHEWDKKEKELAAKAPPAKEKAENDQLLKEAEARKKDAENNLAAAQKESQEAQAKLQTTAAQTQKEAAPLASSGLPDSSVLPE